MDLRGALPGPGTLVSHRCYLELGLVFGMERGVLALSFGEEGDLLVGFGKG